MKRIFILISFFCLVGVANNTFAQSVKINHNGTNGLTVESDGTIQFDGAATVWDDIIVPFTQAKQGSNFIPAFDYTNIGLIFEPSKPEEKIYMVVQIPHSYKLGSNIFPHIHWQQTSTSFPTWKMDYKWFNIGDPVPATFTTIDTNSREKTYISGSIHQVSSFGAINGVAKGISSILLIKLYRDDSVTGNVLGFQFDIHFEKNTEGSRTEFGK